MAKPANAAVSNTAVREDLWVRFPPAAPFTDRPECIALPPDPWACVDDRGLGQAYVYLLGLYLGDGALTLLQRGVWRLRISQDSRHVELIRACKAATLEVVGRTAGQAIRTGSTDVCSYWKHWRCVFPQHGAGPKHLRAIELTNWQWGLVELYPRELVKGLIHSDGCRVTNRVRSPAGRSYEYPRYHFSNRSDQIKAIFERACAMIGVECRPNNRYNLSVAKRRSVAILDEFIGPKR